MVYRYASIYELVRCLSRNSCIWPYILWGSLLSSSSTYHFFPFRLCLQSHEPRLSVSPPLPAQVWPFAAWAALVIVMNAVPYSLLTSMSSSIALLNLINSVLLRHHHCFYFAMVGDEGGGGDREVQSTRQSVLRHTQG